MLGFSSHLLSKMYSLERQASILRFELDVLKRRRAEFMPGPDDLWYRADEQVQVKVRELEPVETELQTLNEKLLQEFRDAGYMWLREQFPAINRDTSAERVKDNSQDVIRIAKPVPLAFDYTGSVVDFPSVALEREDVHLKTMRLYDRERRMVYEWSVGYSTTLNRLFFRQHPSHLVD